jgi:hypothetical protein
MNRMRRAQIRALAALDPPVSLGGGVALANLVWRVEHEPVAPLRWYELFSLDAALWAHRDRLAGAGVELPSSTPTRRHYQPSMGVQSRLF